MVYLAIKKIYIHLVRTKKEIQKENGDWGGSLLTYFQQPLSFNLFLPLSVREHPWPCDLLSGFWG